MELRFSKAQAQTHNPEFAAWYAGYANPLQKGSQLLRKPAVQDAVRQATQRFLYDDAGAIACKVLAEIALDTAMPAGARVKSASELARLANIAISDQQANKPDHEMTAAELDDMRRKLTAQRAAVESVLAALPAAAIDVETLEVMG